MLQEKLHARASEIAGVGAWVQAAYGFDPWWTCFCFDNAVTRFGGWVESQLSQYDDKGRPRYSLRQLLAPDFEPGRGRKLEGKEAEAVLLQFFG